MRKTMKVSLIITGIILLIVLCLIIFLRIYYSILEKNKLRQDNEISSRFQTITVSQGPQLSGIPDNILNLIPVPQKVVFSGGIFRVPEKVTYSIADTLREFTGTHLNKIPGIQSSCKEAGQNIIFRFRRDIPPQGYSMDIRTSNITVEYSDKQGLYYSIITIKVLKQNYSGKIPCVIIEDYPDLEVRGVMLDISRDKVPTIGTLKGIVQLLSDLKYNHFQLYIEGFSFAYPSFRELWEGRETPLTGEEIKELDNFCRDRFIDLVPNQNSLGHMMAWLETDQFRNLAESPKGYKLFGLVSMKGTLNPLDPRSLELVTRMTDDLLPAFSSGSFNANLDEPFELGHGKSKKAAKEKGVENIYLDYALQIYDMLKQRNRTMLMWGDIVLRHPGIINHIPKDITLLDWGYEDVYPYEKNCRLFNQAGVKYMVCPGTNSWTTITGRTDNMLNTIKNAVSSGVNYGASGMLITDWGDMGHWQYLPVSYAGYVSGAALSWNSECRDLMPLAGFLSSYVFGDDSNTMGQLALDMGRYVRYEEIPVPNMTTTMMSFQYGLRDRIMVNQIYETIRKGITGMMNDLAPEISEVFNKRYIDRHPFDYEGLEKFLDYNEALLENVEIRSGYDKTVTDEYRNAIRLIRAGTALQYYISYRNDLGIAEEKEILKEIRSVLEIYMTENERLWMTRNKPGGYERSTKMLTELMVQIDKRMDVLDKPGFIRSINRFLEKVAAAGAVLYLKSAS